jgi:hypothetical protein
MSESPINLSGTLNNCFVFYLRMADCIRRETFFDLMCKDQFEDWTECRTRRRMVRYIIYN